MTLLRGLSEHVAYDKASVQLIRDDKRFLLAAQGFSDRQADRWLLRPLSQDQLIQSVFAQRQPRVVPTTLDAPGWEAMEQTQDVQSWMALPLLHGDEPIALITLDHHHPGFYADPARAWAYVQPFAMPIAQAYLIDTAHRHVRDMEILNDVVQVLSTKLRIEHVLNTITKLVAKRLTCTHCTVFLAETIDGTTYLVAKQTHGGRPEVKSRRFRPPEGLAGWVYLHGRSLNLANAAEDDRFAAARQARDQPRSMIVAPITVGDQTIGVLSADQDAYGWFTESDQRLLEALAKQAGVAVQRAQGLTLLQDIGNRILELKRVGEILPALLSGAIELTHATTGVIYLVSEDGKKVTETYHLPDFIHPPPRMSFEEGLTRTVVRTGDVLSISDLAAHKSANPELTRHYKSLIAVPIMTEHKIIGVLYVDDRDSHDFSETEISLLKTLASQAAIAIQNAQILDRLMRVGELGLLATGIVHEFRSSLQRIEAYLNRLRRGADKPEDADVNISHEISRASRSVSLFYQIRNHSYEIETIDVQQLISTLVQLCADHCLERGIEITYEHSGNPRIRTNASAFHCVVANLLRNALDALEKFSGQRRVEIVTRRTTQSISLAISDSGPGIPTAQVPTLFVPFAGSKGGSGLGMGLFFASQLVQDLRGELRAAPPGALGGARFELTLPAAEEADA